LIRRFAFSLASAPKDEERQPFRVTSGDDYLRDAPSRETPKAVKADPPTSLAGGINYSVLLAIIIIYIHIHCFNISKGLAYSFRPVHTTAFSAAMSYIRRMTPMDLFSLNLTNLDALTENYDLGFYLNYLMRWPSLFSVVQDRDAGTVGYSKEERSIYSRKES
jgi:hypothetical protein